MHDLRRMLKIAVAYLLYATRLYLLIRAVRDWWSPGLTVITYHRVGPPRAGCGHDDEFEEGVSVARFRSEIAYLARRHVVLSLEEAIRRLMAGEKLPWHAICIAFDDGYAELFDCAWPVLRAFGVPATIFVPTDFLDGKPAWEHHVEALIRLAPPGTRLKGMLTDAQETERPMVLNDRTQRAPQAATLIQALRSLSESERAERLRTLQQQLPYGCFAESLEFPLLSPEQIRAMAAESITFGSHTRSHCLLPVIPPEMVRDELAGSREALERLLNRPVTMIAYPQGACNEAVKRSAAESGYAIGVSVAWARNHRDTEPYDVHRIPAVNLPLPRFVMKVNALISDP